MLLTISFFLFITLVAGQGIYLPLIRKETPPELRRRDGSTAVGLGDYADITYNVLLKIGSATVPLVVDTGSSDLWVVSDGCSSCPPTIPVYSQKSFQPTSPPLPAELFYGDSFTGTHAFGEIGSDNVALAALAETKQYFAAITDTNTTVLKTGNAGIFGLGFPLNSFVWSKVFKAEFIQGAASERRNVDWVDYRRTKFPSISSLYPTSQSAKGKRQSTINPGDWTLTILSSYLNSGGPFLSRLVLSSSLSSPMYTISLQRDSFEIGGNAGLLSIGALPSGISNESITWVPLRGYKESEGGLSPPTNSPNEVYPLTWEMPIDDVYFDGQKLPRSQLSSPTISLSALVDTGNSLIRGPRDVISSILTSLGANSQGIFPCSTPHTLAFSIGGKLFKIDPRDFVSQALEGRTDQCVANVAVTDSPVEGGGYLYSWSLGDPFLKSVISSYYFGNITYPSTNPPRMGFLSTVPDNADQLYVDAIKAAQASGGNYPYTIESAPTGLPTKPMQTQSNGVVVVATTPEPSSTGSPGDGGGEDSGNPSAARRVEVGISLIITVLAGFLVCW